jgi:hypothetical protein
MIKTSALVVLSAAGAMLAMSSSAFAYKCQANSPSAWGQGWHTNSIAYARDRALVECAARTPRGQMCYIRWCR